MNVRIEDFDNMTWFDTLNNFRDESMRYLAHHVVIDAENALDVIQKHVESLSDSDAFECFEVMRFNYEFLSQECINAAAEKMKAASAPFHEAERAHAINERASETAIIEWKSKISGLEGLRYEVEKILNPPPLYGFSMPRLSRRFWVHGLDPHQYLETAPHLYNQLSELRNEVNKHALQTGAITGIRSVRKMRQLMMELDAAAKYLEKLESEFRTSSIRFKHVSDAYNESRSNLIHELRKIGTAGEIGLLRLYEKLAATQKSSDDQPETAVANVRLVADATCP